MSDPCTKCGGTKFSESGREYNRDTGEYFLWMECHHCGRMRREKQEPRK